MKWYVSSINLVEEINKNLNNNTAIDFWENKNLILLDWLKKIEWNFEEKFIYNIFLKDDYDWSHLDYYKFEKKLFLDDKWNLSFIPLLIELNKFLISNLENEYLEYNRVLVYVDRKEILNLDFQFILKSISKMNYFKKDKNDILRCFIQNTIDIMQKSFYQSEKIEIFFFWKNDYFKL